VVGSGLILPACHLKGGAKEYSNPDPLLAKEVTAPAGPAGAQVTSNAGCSVNDRESPWVTLLTGTCRARAGPLAADRSQRAAATRPPDRVPELKWLAECSAEALREALRAVAPELSGCPVTVPVPDPAAKADPVWWSSSAAVGERFIAKFAWSRAAALRLAKEIGILTALART
jgi:hypothetical protein